MSGRTMARLCASSLRSVRTLMRLREHLDSLVPNAIHHQISDPLPTEVMSMLEIKGLLHRLLLVVEDCHSSTIIHRGLSPDNVLIRFWHFNVCLSDFRSGKYIGVPPSLVPYEFDSDDGGDFTPPGQVFSSYFFYSAPEMLMGATTYSPAVDVWSIGMIYAEMTNGRPLVERVWTDRGQLRAIICVLGLPSIHERTLIPGVKDFPWNDYKDIPMVPINALAALVPRLAPEGVDLLSKMLEWVPSNRITTQQALNHPFFSDILGKQL